MVDVLQLDVLEILNFFDDDSLLVLFIGMYVTLPYRFGDMPNDILFSRFFFKFFIGKNENEVIFRLKYSAKFQP